MLHWLGDLSNSLSDYLLQQSSNLLQKSTCSDVPEGSDTDIMIRESIVPNTVARGYVKCYSPLLSPAFALLPDYSDGNMKQQLLREPSFCISNYFFQHPANLLLASNTGGIGHLHAHISAVKPDISDEKYSSTPQFSDCPLFTSRNGASIRQKLLPNCYYQNQCNPMLTDAARIKSGCSSGDADMQHTPCYKKHHPLASAKKQNMYVREANDEILGQNSLIEPQKHLILNKLDDKQLGVMQKRLDFNCNESFINRHVTDPGEVTLRLYVENKKITARGESVCQLVMMTELVVTLMKSFLWPNNDVRLMWVRSLYHHKKQWQAADSNVQLLFLHQSFNETHEAAILFSSSAASLVRHPDLIFFHNMSQVLQIPQKHLLILKES